MLPDITIQYDRACITARWRRASRKRKRRFSDSPAAAPNVHHIITSHAYYSSRPPAWQQHGESGKRIVDVVRPIVLILIHMTVTYFICYQSKREAIQCSVDRVVTGVRGHRIQPVPQNRAQRINRQTGSIIPHYRIEHASIDTTNNDKCLHPAAAAAAVFHLLCAGIIRIKTHLERCIMYSYS